MEGSLVGRRVFFLTGDFSCTLKSVFLKS